MLAVTLLGALALGAQQAPPPPTSTTSTAPEFGASIDVRAVNVEVVVTDRRGQRVPGLKAADFQLLVDGKPMVIDEFAEVQGGQVAEPVKPAEAVAEPAAAPAAPAAARAGINYLAFVDNSFAVGADRDFLLQRLDADLPVGPEDRMAIVTWDGDRLTLARDWTGDAAALRQALRELQKTPASGIDRLVERRRAGEAGILGFGEVENLRQEAEGAARAAAAAMRGVSLVPGRKVLLLISGGWPALPQQPLLGFPETRSGLFGNAGEAEVLRQSTLPSVANLTAFHDLFEPVSGTANLLGYTIYPVTAPQHGPGELWNPIEASGPSEQALISSPWSSNITDTMGYLARETGGKLLYSSLRHSAFSRISEDARSYYGLGFSPEWRADGQKHRIDVKVLRPGLKARSRSGFADLSKGEEAGLKTDSVLLFGHRPDAVKVEIETGPPKWAGLGTIELPVTLLVPIKVLTALPVEGGYELRARLSMNISDRWGGKSQSRDVPLVLKVPEAPRPDGVARYQTTLKLRKSEQTLTVAIQDEEGNGMGWAQIDYKP
jgi:VWFA-related protein